MGPLISAVIIAGLIYVSTLLPKGTSGSFLAFLVAVVYRTYAHYVLDPTIAEGKSVGWLQFSWRRAMGISLAFLLATLAIAFAAVFLFRLT